MLNEITQARKDLRAPVSFGGSGDSGSGSGGQAHDPHDPNIQGIGYDVWDMPQTSGSQNIQTQMVQGAVVGATGGAVMGPKSAAIGGVTGATAGAMNAFGENVGWW